MEGEGVFMSLSEELSQFLRENVSQEINQFYNRGTEFLISFIIAGFPRTVVALAI
jgi:hypothetical protein